MEKVLHIVPNNTWKEQAYSLPEQCESPSYWALADKHVLCIPPEKEIQMKQKGIIKRNSKSKENVKKKQTNIEDSVLKCVVDIEYRNYVK